MVHVAERQNYSIFAPLLCDRYPGTPHAVTLAFDLTSDRSAALSASGKKGAVNTAKSRVPDSRAARNLSVGLVGKRCCGWRGHCRCSAADWRCVSRYRWAAACRWPLCEYSATIFGSSRQLIVGPDAATLTILAAALS